MRWSIDEVFRHCQRKPSSSSQLLTGNGRKGTESAKIAVVQRPPRRVRAHQQKANGPSSAFGIAGADW
jgi:hypothetical protein